MNRLLQAVQRDLVPAVGVLIFASMTTSGAQAADRDRACLKSMITKYVDAMVAHDPRSCRSPEGPLHGRFKGARPW